MKKNYNSNKFYFYIIFFPFISWIFLVFFFGDSFKKFDELALGKENVKVIGKILGQNILCDSADNIEDCINFLKKNLKKKILWIGNSQLYAVNQGSINTKTAPHRVSEYFYKKEIGLVTFAAPNISFQEYLEVVSYLTKRVDFDIVILSLVFDDTREDGIRKNLIIKQKENTNKKNLQEFTEDKIVKFLDSKINWTYIRSQVQGIIYESLYKLRNNLFGINPSSVRKSIKPIYERNLNALNKTIDVLKNKKIYTVMYIAPIRDDIQLPYNLKEYTSFKNILKIKAKNFSSLFFYNLENIVPGNLWGEKKGTKFGVSTEVDFMHFKEDGHKILTEEIIKIVEKIIK